MRTKARDFLFVVRALIVFGVCLLALYVFEIGWRRGVEIAMSALGIWVVCLLLEWYFLESVVPALFGLTVTHSEGSSGTTYIEPKPYKGHSFVTYNSPAANAIAPGGGAEVEGLELERSEVKTLVMETEHSSSLEMMEALLQLKALRDAAIKKRKEEQRGSAI